MDSPWHARLLWAVPVLLAGLLLGCPGERTPAEPEDDTAVLRIVNASNAETDVVRGVHVRGPNTIGFGLSLMGEEETIAPGEALDFILDTQGSVVDWQVRLAYTAEDGETYTQTAEFSLVRPGELYIWNWAGHEANLEAIAGELEGELDSDFEAVLQAICGAL